MSTVRTILDLDAGPIVVRQHPSERRKMQRSRLDMGALIENTFRGDPRCRFIAASDPVSSYDLLQSSRLVLPYVSTIGIEAAAMGKPVLISGDCYYAGLGFVWSATSREEYFRLLGSGLRGDLPLREEQAERAWLCYYLTAVQNRVPTDFTPHPDDFWSWCGRSPAALFSDPVVADILEALDSNVPLSLLRHERERATTRSGTVIKRGRRGRGRPLREVPPSPARDPRLRWPTDGTDWSARRRRRATGNRGGQVSDSVQIADRRVGRDEPCFVVAEIGINHNGDLNFGAEADCRRRCRRRRRR